MDLFLLDDLLALYFPLFLLLLGPPVLEGWGSLWSGREEFAASSVISELEEGKVWKWGFSAFIN